MRPGLKGLSMITLLAISCGSENRESAPALISLNLKRGDIVSCGPAEPQYGSVNFDITASDTIQKQFNHGLSLLHSFEYDDAEKVFAKIIDQDSKCAMAYWGVAMSNNHSLWAPPTPAELEKGAAAIEIAQSVKDKSAMETAFIDATAEFYRNRASADHASRTAALERAMEKLYARYSQNIEAAIFYSLALNAAADPKDKSFFKQKKAGKILDSLFATNPIHPGVVHYIIHSYDYPELAGAALEAARKYAFIAPSSAHAQHMPSHVFTRLGLWDEDITSNLASVASAKCYAKNNGIDGHWDEELHGLDYLVYAYLQKGDSAEAKVYVDYLDTIKKVEPENFKVAYAYAAVPVRYVLESRQWNAAAKLKFHPDNFPWERYPWQKAILHFGRSIGNVHVGNIPAAENEVHSMKILYDTLIAQGDVYKADQVLIQMQSAKAWILFKKGENDEALKLMQEAADREDNTQKHPVTPGEVLPAREMLGDMLLAMNKADEAVAAYEADLKTHPHRRNGLIGLASAKDQIKKKSLSR